MAGQRTPTGQTAGQLTRWMQHGACIGLMALVAVACAAGASLPAAETVPRAMQHREARPLLAHGLTAPSADTTLAGAQQ
jgi:hypothetical protein